MSLGSLTRCCKGTGPDGVCGWEDEIDREGGNSRGQDDDDETPGIVGVVTLGGAPVLTFNVSDDGHVFVVIDEMGATKVDESATERSIPEVSVVGLVRLCIAVNGKGEWEE